jgi:hypothetical protein
MESLDNRFTSQVDFNTYLWKVYYRKIDIIPVL